MLELTAHQLRSLAIFFGYNITCFLIACRCIHIIAREHSRGPSSPSSSWSDNDARHRRRMRLFSVTTVLSITVTWYFMISFYVHSYQTWLAEHAVPPAQSLGQEDGPVVRLASWLEDTKLFEQAWAAVVETPSRLWWSQQIFGFCAGWSIFLGVQAREHGIRGLWWFMLLGQIVSISFASNLSFLAVLGARRANAKPTGKSSSSSGERSGVALHLVLIVSAVCAVMVPLAHAQREFMPVLLVPHVLAFAPLLPGLRPVRGTAHFATATAAAVVLLAQTTLKVVTEGATVGHLLSVLHEHPAVSSVGWDVIFCHLSYALWYALE